MNKKKIVALVLGAMLTAGVAFNFATTASYREDLGSATQSLTAGTWSVQMENGLKAHTIFPGDVIGEDTITLTNKNDYAVRYTINLSTTGDEKFDKALTLDLLKNGQSTGVTNPDGTIEFLAAANSEYVLTSKVTWTPSETVNEDITHQGKNVSYKYNVTAEAIPANILVGEGLEFKNIQAAIDSAKTGDTIFVTSGEYIGNSQSNYDNRTNSINVDKAITLLGEEGTLIKDSVIDVNVEGVVLKGLDFNYTGKDTTYGIIVSFKDNTEVVDCNIVANFTNKIDGSLGTEGNFRFGTVRLSGENSKIINSKIKSNAMAVFGTPKTGLIENNIFENLDGYTTRTLALNEANMNGLIIRNNTFNNRHILLGGKATITGNKFINRGANGTGKTAYYFYSNFEGVISGNDYEDFDTIVELYSQKEGVSVIPEIN